MNLSVRSFPSRRGADFFRRLGQINFDLHVSLPSGERELGRYLATLRNHGANTTFAVSGATVRRHRDLNRFLCDRGVEFSIRADFPSERALPSSTDQRIQIAETVDAFVDAGVQVSGFHAPRVFLDQVTMAAIEHLGFEYFCNQTVFYHCVDQTASSAGRWTRFQKALGRHEVVPSDETLVRPRMRGRLVELPVAQPDDEMLIRGLGMSRGEDLGQAWVRAAEDSYRQGDLLVIQAHPSGGASGREALAIALSCALDKSPSIWIAQLREIAAWWRARERCQLRVEPTGPQQWRVSVADDPRFTILVRNVVCARANPWDNVYRAVQGSSCLIEGPTCPTVGVSSRSEGLAAFLIEEGYVVNVGADPTTCSIYLDRPSPPTSREQAAIIKEIEASSKPIVRLARWPDGARSALAVCGTLGDLSIRDLIAHVWGERR